MDFLAKKEISQKNPEDIINSIVMSVSDLYSSYKSAKDSGLINDPKLYINLFEILKKIGISVDELSDTKNLHNLLVTKFENKKLSLTNLVDILTQINLAKQAFTTGVNESKNMKKIQNKELLSEELKRFRMLTDYDYYVGKEKVSESFPIVDVRGGENPERLDKIIYGDVSEVEGDEDLEKDASGIEDDLGLTDEPAPETTDVDVTDTPAPEGGEDINIDATEEPAPAVDATEPDMGGDEVELDVTELVKGSEAAKASADAANSKIEQLMGMVDKLEGQLQSMSAISTKIEDLEKEIERRNPTPTEKLEMRSLDSFPYNIKLSDFWADKGDRYDTGAEPKEPTEYVLTQQDVDDSYSETDIEDSFDENETN